MRHRVVTVLPFAVFAVAQIPPGLYDFPQYPPPMTPPANITLANAQAPLANFSPPSEVPSDPVLAKGQVHFDTGRYGPQIELVHLYFNFWPTGVGVTSTGRIFTCYPRGNETFTLAEVNSSTTETPWPTLDFNTPPAIFNASNPQYSVATPKLLFVQSVVVDGMDRIWALDTGRPIVNGTALLAAVPGGPKLVGFDQNGTAFTSITFPPNVVAADSSLNDVRIDLRGGGFAYITDSSTQRPGIVVVDLSSGASWRHLDGHPSVSVVPGFVPVYNGVPLYVHPPTTPNAVTYFTIFAADGIALSAGGDWLYICPISSRRLYRVPTDVLKSQPSSTNTQALILASRAVQDLGEKGSHSDGLETDSNDYIYNTAPEHNSITRYNPNTGEIEPFVRDPAIQFPDTLSTVSLANNGGDFIYFTANQLWLRPDYQNATDLRTKPYAIFRVPIDGGKATQMQ